MSDHEAYEFAKFCAHHSWEDVLADPRAAGVDPAALRGAWERLNREFLKG